MELQKLVKKENVIKRFEKVLGRKSEGFLASVLQLTQTNGYLAKAEPESVLKAAMVAATLDLPINNNLGFAYIIPYNTRQKDGSYRNTAQFQMGYKGLIQLAQRSGQYETINATDVREGEIESHDRLTGEITFDWLEDEDRNKKAVIGFVAYFKLLNGFKKSLYMTVDELEAHGKRYSKTFGNKNSTWNTDFEAMSKKTVLKLLISKYGPQSIQMQKAMVTDQAEINDWDTEDVTYIDNGEDEAESPESKRVRLMIEDAESVDALDQLKESVPEDQIELFENKKRELQDA